MFLYMSVKKSSANDIRNTEKSITLSSGIVYIKALIPASWCSFWQTMTLKSKKRQGE